MLREWNKVPEYMKSSEVKKYYDVLSKKRISLVLKRIFDICGSLVLIIILSPIFMILSIWIKLDSKGPVFYRQERVTSYGNLFHIFKFRTMKVDADKIGSLVTLKNDSRITNVGQKIRKYRVDEIPQLINVLLGEMSFVGTRPEVKKYVDAYTDDMMATLLLPAGITSLASIKFKNEDSILDEHKDKMSIDEIYIKMILPEKMKFNLEYILNYGVMKDIILCMRTLIQ